MSIYIAAVILAALIQIGTIYLLRTHLAANFLYVIPLILAHQFLFLWSYTNAPKFIIIWFVTTAITGGLAFIIGHFIWHESISVWNILGIVLVLLGLMLLQIK